MNPEDALDLRALADVESPHVVQGALRRFRRKVFTTGALVLLAVACLAGGVVWATVFYQTSAERIESAPGAVVGAVYSDEDVTVILRRVARIDDGLALHLFVAAPDATPDVRHFVRTQGIRYADYVGPPKANDIYLVITPPELGRIEMRLFRQRGCDAPPGGGLCRNTPKLVFPLDVDLTALDVPESIWSNGG